MPTNDPLLPRSGEIAIADLLDRALHKGLVLWGEATISVAGVDLVYLGLKVLLASTDTANRMRDAAAGAGWPLEPPRDRPQAGDAALFGALEHPFRGPVPDNREG